MVDNTSRRSPLLQFSLAACFVVVTATAIVLALRQPSLARSAAATSLRAAGAEVENLAPQGSQSLIDWLLFGDRSLRSGVFVYINCAECGRIDPADLEVLSPSKVRLLNCESAGSLIGHAEGLVTLELVNCRNLKFNNAMGSHGLTISVHDCDLPPDEMMHIASLPKLYMLYISHQRLSQEHIKAFATSSTIQGVSLSDVQLNPGALLPLRNTSRLDSLSISRTSLGQEDIAVIQTMQSLRFLSFGKGTVPQEAQQRIKEALKECEVSF